MSNSYFEILFSEILTKIKDSHIEHKSYSDAQEDHLYKAFNRADKNLGYGLLERINRKRDKYFFLFNDHVSPEMQEKIRLFLLKQYILMKDRKRIDHLLDLINNSGSFNKEIKFFLFNGDKNDLLNIKFLISFIAERSEQLYAVKDNSIIINRFIEKRKFLDKDFLQDTATYRKSKERMISKLNTITKKFEGRDVNKDAAKINVKAYKINEDERKNLEELVVLVNQLNHTEFIAALLQFRVDGLEKRLKKLEKQNQTTFFGFLTEFLLTFVVPFGIGKLAEITVLKLAKNSTRIAHKLNNKESKLRDMLKGTDFDVDIYDEIMRGQEILIGKFDNKFNKLPDYIKTHLDDYTQFTADGIIRIQSYRAERKSSPPKFKNLNDFISYSIEQNRTEIINLESDDGLRTFIDAELITEYNKSLSLNFDFYYKKMKEALAKYEEEEQRRSEAAEKERLIKQYEDDYYLTNVRKR